MHVTVDDVNFLSVESNTLYIPEGGDSHFYLLYSTQNLLFTLQNQAFQAYPKILKI